MRVLLSWAAVIAIVGAACGAAGGSGSTLPTADAAGDPLRGRELYGNACAQCHGTEGQGTEQGPAHVDKLYRANHHGDAAFQLAALRGVQPHHWDFGPMPPIAGVTPDDVTDIIAYVRQLQREAGITD